MEYQKWTIWILEMSMTFFVHVVYVCIMGWVIPGLMSGLMNVSFSKKSLRVWRTIASWHYVSMRLEYNQMYNHVKSVYNYTVYIYVPSITYIPVANNGYLVLLLHVLSWSVVQKYSHSYNLVVLCVRKYNIKSNSW